MPAPRREAPSPSVEQARAQAPEELAAWVDAHQAYYDAFLVDCASRGAFDSSDAAVAREQRARWADVRTGAAPFVEPPMAFVAPDAERYRRLFGIDPVTFEDV